MYCNTLTDRELDPFVFPCHGLDRVYVDLVYVAFLIPHVLLTSVVLLAPVVLLASCYFSCMS
jgi:hypothetical protein